MLRSLLAAIILSQGSFALAGDGNRLAYLDDNSPYYPHRTFPKLITPQWVGEEGVDAVVILAIDDMNAIEKWELFLRPILERLKKIDGRAPVSIMTVKIDPKTEHLQKWLKEGVSLETHTADHPCPMFRKGDFAFAKTTFERCVDQLAEVPGSKPVAFRTPCCDSLNTLSPKLFAGIFNSKTPKGNFLQIDSSVFTWFTPNDPDLPRDLVYDKDGRMRFAKYFPAEKTFVNTIEDYPYPYVINRLCWEFPCMTPSDWQAQQLNKPNNPKTLEDWKAALDCTVIKQGVFTAVFHPHGWIKNEQIVDFIDYAQTKYGKRVKFLNFPEALARLNKNLLAGQPLRDPRTAEDNGMRLFDAGGSSVFRVVVAKNKPDRVWHEVTMQWEVRDDTNYGRFLESDSARRILIEEKSCFVRVSQGGKLVEEMHFGPAPRKLPFSLPEGARLPSKHGEDTGLRFVDLDGDGKLDVIFSDENGYGVYLFESMERGWSRKVMAGKRGDPGEIPPIAFKGVNNGAWIADRHIWWVNENTDLLKDLTDRRSFNELLSTVEPGAKSPEASLNLMKARPGFRVELMAAEPLVHDPIAFAFGPDGKLWVVEMGDYPLGLDGKGKFGGKIKFLESTKGDGKFDKATVFLDGIGFPTSVLPWKKGVLVTCAPDIFYAEDTDGDGRADVKKILFTGFVEGNQQHRVNTLAWGLGNWIHCANGDSGGIVKSMLTGKSVNIRGRDFRIRPDTGEIEVEAGQSQYGRCRDDWGNWFGCNNSNPLWHVAIVDHYLKRNPLVASPPPTLPVPALPGAAPVYPISRTLPRFNDPNGANRFTSACSATIYRDDLFGPHFSDSAFVSEPVHNLVHRESLSAEGTTIRGRRGPDEWRSEFLASADNWHRPTTIATGPDGGLWVADMYRQVIEHPQWIPLDVQKKLDLRAGHDQGRIFRVLPVGAKPRAIPRLDKLDGEQLVAALDCPNGWQRDTVQQMLIWQNDRRCVGALEKLWRESKNPLARLHALCTLDGLAALKPEVAAAALKDSHPGVVRHAIRLSEGRFDDPQQCRGLVDLAGHPDPQVRLQLAYTLGEWRSAGGGKALGELARSSGSNRYLLAAAMSSLNKTNYACFAEAVLRPSEAAPPPGLLDGLLTFAAANKDRRGMAELLSAAADSREGRFAAWQLDTLATLLDALDRQKLTLADLSRDVGEELTNSLKRLNLAFAQARLTVRDERAPFEDRIHAMRLLARGGDQRAADLKVLAELLSPQTLGELQSAALSALTRSGAPEAPELLFARWKSFSPALRAQALAALLDHKEWVAPLLAALEKQQILPAETDAAGRERLLASTDKSVRERAVKILANAVDANRQKVIDGYKPALAKMGDRERGKQVFARACAACHKIGELGQGLAPDLTALSDKSPGYLLTNILDPNRAVEARFISYKATLKDGSSRIGFLSAETSTSITLVGTDGKQQSVLRMDVDDLRSSGKSIMPDGLEKDVSIDQMADLLAFLLNSLSQPKRKEFPGNKPELVKPVGDGSLTLSASNCEIYGKTLVFEAKYGNLGFWGSEDDRAAWTIALPKAGDYDVFLDWACDENNGGEAFVLQGGEKEIRGRVASTGSWDNFKQVKTGTIALGSGEQRIVIRSAGPLKGYLMDLRGLRLVPEKK